MSHSRLGYTDSVRVPSVTICDLSHCSIRIWPTDVAEDTSLLTDIDGFDISDKFFPPRAWLPNNVKLHLHDIYNPFPEHFQRHFDLVHLRLFLTLSTIQVTQILENAMTLLSTSSWYRCGQLTSLEPGGYIQWTEHDKTAITPIAASPTQPTTAAQAFIDLEQNPFPNSNATYVSSPSHRLNPGLNRTLAGFTILAP